MTTEKRLIGYYVVRNKNTGFYFRGKGANRWGEYYNQASIYRMKAHAENTANWLNLRGEPVEIVPIKIVENLAVDAVEAEKYNDLLDAFIDYVCSGIPNVAPYCCNRCRECVDGRGWCKEDPATCRGFNPDVRKMDGDGNA